MVYGIAIMEGENNPRLVNVLLFKSESERNKQLRNIYFEFPQYITDVFEAEVR